MMNSSKFKRSKKIGLPPGTLVYMGGEEAKRTKITIIDYDEKEYDIKEIDKVDEIIKPSNKTKVRWINIEGLRNIDIIKTIGQQFNLHPLLLEDIVSTEQRPKLEIYDDYIALFLNLLFWKGEKSQIRKLQTVLLLGENYVISFEDKEKGVFEVIRERIKTAKGRVRSSKADYLFYVLLDIIIDNYFLALENIGLLIEDLEEELELEPSRETGLKIFSLRREMISSRKFVRPLKDVISNLLRDELILIQDNTKIFIKDVQDHILQIIENFDGFKEILGGMRESYQSIITEKMNKIINILTIITTIFIPLSFLTGLYGMNFAYMPELLNPIGYFILLFFMVFIGISMLIFFKVKKWI